MHFKDGSYCSRDFTFEVPYIISISIVAFRNKFGSFVEGAGLVTLCSEKLHKLQYFEPLSYSILYSYRGGGGGDVKFQALPERIEYYGVSP